MIKSTLCLLTATLAFQAGAAPTNTSAHSRSLPAPAIESVAMDAGRITVTGIFYSAVTPQLTLGRHRLEVSDATQTQVIAKLPQNLPPATYRLLINNPNSSGNATSLYVLIPRSSDLVQVVSAGALPLK